MAGYKIPDFNERTAAARAAKQSNLEKLRSKPAPDAALIAEKQAAHAARDAAAAERRADRARAAEEAKAARAEAKRLALEASAALAALSERPKLSEAERKAERDARYAARKARKK